MTIPKKIVDHWELLYSQGDAIRIGEEADVHPETVRRVFRTRRASDDLFVTMKDYYERKQQILNDND